MTTTQIEANLSYQKLLGWNPNDFGAFHVDDLLVANVTAKQQLWKVTADGIAGPTTYGMALKDQLAEAMRTYDTLSPSSRLVVGGQIAVLQGKILWLTDVTDLPSQTSPDYARCQSVIDRMYRTPAGINWYWRPPYQMNKFEWCGAFAAYCWAMAGLALKSRYSYFSSTYRLDCWPQYIDYDPSAPNPKPAQGPYRMMIELTEKSTPRAAVFSDGSVPRAGDIVMMGMADSDYGTHIGVVESFDPATGIFTTIEGNGTAAGPRGNRQHGVVRAQRMIGIPTGLPPQTYHIRRVIRPAPADLA